MYSQNSIVERILVSMHFLLLFGSTTVVGQGLNVPYVGLAFSDYWITPHSRIVSQMYGGTIYLVLEPMMGMLLSRSSWRLHHETGMLFSVTKSVGKQTLFRCNRAFSAQNLIQLNISFSWTWHGSSFFSNSSLTNAHNQETSLLAVVLLSYT